MYFAALQGLPMFEQIASNRHPFIIRVYVPQDRLGREGGTVDWLWRICGSFTLGPETVGFFSHDDDA